MLLEQIVLYALIYIVEAIILLQYCNSLFKRRYSQAVTSTCVIFLYIIPFVTVIYNNSFANGLSFFLATYLFITIFYYCNKLVALFHTSMLTIIMGLCELIVLSLLKIFIADFPVTMENYTNLIILAILSKTLYLFIVRLILLFRQKNNTNHQSSECMLALSIIPLTSFSVMITFILINFEYNTYGKTNLFIIGSSFLLLFANLISFSIYTSIQHNNDEYTVLKLQLQKESDTIKYYKMINKQYETKNVLIHDIRKLLNTLSILNKTGDTEKIDEYLRNISGIEALQTPIKVCDNELLNSILAQYIKRSKENHMNFEIDIRKNTVNFLSEDDLTSLICNLLDNSFEAAINCDNANITLNIYPKNSTIVFSIINSCHVKPLYSPHGELISTKENNTINHGYGLKSINRIVKKYSGTLQMYYEDNLNTFHTIIAFPLSYESHPYSAN